MKAPFGNGGTSHVSKITQVLNKESSEPKKEHYVPRFYLKAFANFKGPKDDDGYLYVFDKKTGRSYQSSVANAASEKYFYDVPLQIAKQPENVKFIEKGLSELEEKYSWVLRGFCQIFQNTLK